MDSIGPRFSHFFLKNVQIIDTFMVNTSSTSYTIHRTPDYDFLTLIHSYFVFSHSSHETTRIIMNNNNCCRIFRPNKVSLFHSGTTTNTQLIYLSQPGFIFKISYSDLWEDLSHVVHVQNYGWLTHPPDPDSGTRFPISA